jgi:hypothetical protein
MDVGVDCGKDANNLIKVVLGLGCRMKWVSWTRYSGLISD